MSVGIRSFITIEVSSYRSFDVLPRISPHVGSYEHSAFCFLVTAIVSYPIAEDSSLILQIYSLLPNRFGHDTTSSYGVTMLVSGMIIRSVQFQVCRVTDSSFTILLL